MLLRCLAGRYAGEIQDYSMAAGLAALRTGMAERLGDAGPVQRVTVATAGAVAAAPVAPKVVAPQKHKSRK